MHSVFGVTFPKEFPATYSKPMPEGCFDYFKLVTASTVRFDQKTTPQHIRGAMAHLKENEYLVVLLGKTRCSVTFDSTLLLPDYYKQEAAWINGPYNLIFISNINKMAINVCNSNNIAFFIDYVNRQYEIATALEHAGKFSNNKKQVIMRVLAIANARLMNNPAYPETLRRANEKPLSIFDNIEGNLELALQSLDDKYGVDEHYDQRTASPLVFMREGIVKSLDTFKEKEAREICSPFHFARLANRNLMIELFHWSEKIDRRLLKQFTADLMFDGCAFTQIPEIPTDVLVMIGSLKSVISKRESVTKFVGDILRLGRLSILPTEAQVAAFLLKLQQDIESKKVRDISIDDVLKNFMENILVALQAYISSEPEINLYEELQAYEKCILIDRLRKTADKKEDEEIVLTGVKIAP